MRRRRNTRYTPKEAFRIAYNNEKNFMTPNILRTISKGNLHIELSYGSGFENDTIYGVTVLRELPDGSLKKEHDLSKSFSSKQDAEKYIRFLK